MKIPATLSDCLIIAYSTSALLSASPTSAAPQLTVADSKMPVRIVCSKSPAEMEMGKYLIKFLRARKFAVQPNFVNSYNASYAGPQWVLATAKTYGTLNLPDKCPVFAPGTKDEAYVFNAVRGAKAPVVTMIGKTPSGLRAAVARLIGKSANYGRYLAITPGKEVVDPLIELRMMNVGQAARRQAPVGSPFEYANYETWDPAKIRAYPEMIWQLGFNGVQVDECRGYGAISGDEFNRARRAVLTVSKGAHDWHLFVSLSQWGDVLYKEEVTNCWNNPKDHQLILDFIKEFAKTYAPYADNITCRFCDPGGCTSNGCDLYKTPQVITNEYLKEFRKYNPSITGTLSLWANTDFWFYSPKPIDMTNISYGHSLGSQPAGSLFGRPIPDGGKFLDTTFMPKYIGIALHRVYNQDQTRTIVESGRPVDIKGWYIGDQEMNDNLTINMSSVDRILSKYPEEARHTVRSQTIEMCFHGLPQVVNQYVAAQKLINPKRDLNTLMHEFCTAVYGPQNAKAVTDLYFACENGTESAIPRPSDFGTAAYNVKMRRVLHEASAVKIAAGWKPNFAMPMPAQHYVDMLIARLRLTLAVSEAKQAVDAARRQNSISGKGVKRSIHVDVQNADGGNIVSPGGKDPELVTVLAKGGTIGQSFTAGNGFAKIGLYYTTLGSANSGLTVSLYDSVGGNLIKSETFTNLPDNQHIWLYTQQPAGKYYLELSAPTGDNIAIYNSENSCPEGQFMINRKAIKVEPDLIMQIKEKALKSLPALPIDPIYSQDASVIVQNFRTDSIPEMIMKL